MAYTGLKLELRHIFVDIGEVGVRRVARRDCSLVAFILVSYLRAEQDVVLNSIILIITAFTGSQCHDNLKFDMVPDTPRHPYSGEMQTQACSAGTSRHKSLMGGTAQKSPQPLS